VHDADCRLKAFIEACRGTPSIVRVLPECKFRAWNFGSHDDLIRFIGNDGLERLLYLNTADWKNGPQNVVPALTVDSFEFYSGPRAGYLAFVWQRNTKFWLLKSLHDQPRPRQMPTLPLAENPLLMKMLAQFQAKDDEE
jgi:hypothetical protein